MKFLKSIISEKPGNRGRFVYIKLNDNIDEALKIDHKSLEEKSAKKMITEGKLSALAELPNWATEIAKNAEGGNIEAGSNKAERLAKSVKASVLKVISNGVSRTDENTHGLTELITDLKEEKNKSEATVGSIDFALGNVEKLSESLMAKLNGMRRYKKDIQEKKHFWEINKGRRKWKYQFFKQKHSDSEKFDSRVDIIKGALDKLQEEVKYRKNNAENALAKNAKDAENAYDELSSEDQTEFLEEMNIEINVGPILGPKFMTGVMNSMSYGHRLEIYKKANFDPTERNRALKLSTANFKGESDKYAQSQVAFKNHQGKLTKLTDLKTNFAGSMPDQKIEPNNDLSGLVKDLENNFKGEDFFDGYPPNYELTDLQKITAFLAKIGNGKGSEGTRIPRDLRIKLLGYLAHINTQENGDEFNKYSTKFVDAESSAKETLEKTAKPSLEKLNGYKDLSEIDDDVLDGINEDSYKLTLKVDELKEVAKKLSGEEKNLLDKYIKTLEEAVKAMLEIRGIWFKEISDFKTNSTSEKSKLTEMGAKINSYGISLSPKAKFESDIIKAYGILNAEISNGKKSKDRIYNTKRRDKLGETLVLYKSYKKTSLKSAKFTKFNTKIKYELKNIDRDIDTINKAGTRNTKKGKIENNIKQFIERQAKNDDNEKSKAEFQKHQEEMLQTLGTKMLGSKVQLSGVAYSDTGSAPNLAELTGKTPLNINDAVVWGKATDTVILHSKMSNEVIIIQKSKETGKVEMIGFHLGSVTDKDAAIDEFREKQARNETSFIASPTSIMPI